MISEHINMCVSLYVCSLWLYYVCRCACWWPHADRCVFCVHMMRVQYVCMWGEVHSYLLFMKAAAAVCSGVREIPNGVSVVTLSVWDSIRGSQLNRKHLRGEHAAAPLLTSQYSITSQTAAESSQKHTYNICGVGIYFKFINTKLHQVCHCCS